MDTDLLRMETRQRIKAALDTASITISTLAEVTGIPYSNLYRKVSQGTVSLTIDDMLLIAKALNVPAKDLYPPLFFASHDSALDNEVAA